jgi:Spy/CpxP family protein refolding chaperone|tara:strand:+ start:161 stop:424 length:264 start_codon:yes stop_codon:yes gene_type:complete
MHTAQLAERSMGSSSIQVQNLATSSLADVGFTDAMPNVLGSKAKHLDLLEDQRNEIERIVKKKKKQLRNLEHPAEKGTVQVSGFHTM